LSGSENCVPDIYIEHTCDQETIVTHTDYALVANEKIRIR